jgi:hypothetical protein
MFSLLFACDCSPPCPSDNKIQVLPVKTRRRTRRDKDTETEQFYLGNTPTLRESESSDAVRSDRTILTVAEIPAALLDNMGFSFHSPSVSQLSREYVQSRPQDFFNRATPVPEDI